MNARLLTLFAVAGALGALWWFGVFEHATIAAVGELLTGSRWGPVLFCGLFVLGELIAIPSVLFIAAAGLVWPFEYAFAIGWIGSVLSATVVFGFYRYVAADWVERLLPDWMTRWNERVSESGLYWVAVLRLATFLHPATHPALAVSKVSFRNYVIGTGIGIVPGVAATAYFGGAAIRGFSDYGLELLIGGLLIGFAVYAFRRLWPQTSEGA